ncbi:hypothetical protein [Kitasatospora sp. NBC_01266]|uniref:hypothetical protein n=1 Tax=Kitasatospora sp. NBC_01266 TaxID=2903572 RepID=UPI002E3441C4|nr:hypothetical protein [Kitasatospora sp. NBC_01266]
MSERLQPKSPATPDEPALPVPRSLRHPVDFLEANRRLPLESGGGADPYPADDQVQGGVTIDLDAWAGALEGDARILADLAWPLILEFVQQGVQVTVVGDPPEAWTDRAGAAGVKVRPSPRRLPG